MTLTFTFGCFRDAHTKFTRTCDFPNTSPEKGVYSSELWLPKINYKDYVTVHVGVSST